MELYILALLIDSLLLFGLGVIDFLKGECRVELTILVYLAGVSVYPLLPIPTLGKVLLFVFNLILLGLILGIYKSGGGIGLMDIVIASQAPLVFPVLYIITIAFGVSLSLLSIIIHSYRAKKYICSKKMPIPGTNIGVKGWLAWNKWYFIPRDIKSPEKEDEQIKKEKEIWSKRKRCESAKFVIPMVWVYAMFHLGVILTFILFFIFGLKLV